MTLQRKTELRRAPLKPKRQPRKCKACRQPYVPTSTTQRACSPACALELARKERERRQKAEKQAKRRQTRELRERMKTLPQLTKEAQSAFNAYIRERDCGRPCISCGVLESEMAGALTGGMFDCGHYRSVGSAPELRFEPKNAHGQCKRCNRNLSGNAVEYRIRLLGRIGAEAVDWLEGPHEPRRYRHDELREIRDRYRRLARELKKQREAGGDC